MCVCGGAFGWAEWGGVRRGGRLPASMWRISWSTVELSCHVPLCSSDTEWLCFPPVGPLRERKRETNRQTDRQTVCDLSASNLHLCYVLSLGPITAHSHNFLVSARKCSVVSHPGFTLTLRLVFLGSTVILTRIKPLLKTKESNCAFINLYSRTINHWRLRRLAEMSLDTVNRRQQCNMPTSPRNFGRSIFTKLVCKTQS